MYDCPLAAIHNADFKAIKYRRPFNVIARNTMFYVREHNDDFAGTIVETVYPIEGEELEKNA